MKHTGDKLKTAHSEDILYGCSSGAELGCRRSITIEPRIFPPNDSRALDAIVRRNPS